MIRMTRSVEDKVRQLEHCVDNLRAEIDTKMQIIEQILNIRNEQFVLQKKLIEEEHTVYENALSHWRNRAGHRHGLYSSSGDVQSNVTPGFKNTPDYATTATTQNSTPLLSFKRTSSSITFASGGAYSGRLRHKAKRLRTLPTTETDTVEDDNYSEDMDNSCVTEVIPQDSNDPLDAEVEVDLNSGGDSDEETTENGMEKRVFINFYSESGPPQSTDVESSSDPVWLHFLHEEKGSTALCKHCDEKGYQQMYKLKTPAMALALLRRHLMQKHKIVVEAPILPVQEAFDTLEPPRADGRRRLMPFLRHNDYLYTLKNKNVKNTVEYWRCREKNCTGRLVKRPGEIQPTIQHNCLTTAADCEATLFRTKVREIAEAEPTLSPTEVIAVAKIGLPEDVLEIVPNDESLRKTIRRIRQPLDSTPST